MSEIVWRQLLRHISFDGMRVYTACKASIWEETRNGHLNGDFHTQNLI